MYQFLVGKRNNPGNYIWNLLTYGIFAYLVAGTSRALSPNDIPGYFSWRAQTVEIAGVSTKIRGQIASGMNQFSTNATANFPSSGTLSFHFEFTELMQNLDTSIQGLDWAIGSLRISVRRTLEFAILSGILLVTTTVVAAAALFDLGSGISDTLNIVWGIVIIMLVIVLCAMLFRCFLILKISRQEWIENLVRRIRATQR